MGLDNIHADPSRILGWTWYVFRRKLWFINCCSFWAFATDITSPESGKKGFSLVVMIGQIGGILGPAVLCKIPMWYNLVSGNAYVILICGFLIFCIIPLVSLFMRNVSKEQMVGFTEKAKHGEQEEEPGFLEGLKLMISTPFLLGIFGVITFYDVIVTVFDYYFKIMVETQVLDKALKSAYFGNYGAYANLATFLCLLFGISNIQRNWALPHP